MTRPLVVGLYASPERIVQIRQNRLLGLKAHHDEDQYIDRKAVAEEVAFSRKLCAKHNWPSIDVTRRSIEETAAAVLEPAGRAAPAAGGVSGHGALACRPAAGARLEEREPAVRCCKARAFRSRSLAADIDERGIEAKAGLADPGAVAALLAREKAACRVGATCRAGWCSVPTRRWRSGSAASPSRPIARPRASSSRRLRGQTHELHSAVAVVRDGEPVFEHCAVARLTMRAFSDGFLEVYLDAAGDAVTASVGAYQVEGVGIQLFERIEGDHFTILGLPLLPLLRFPAARRAC